MTPISFTSTYRIPITQPGATKWRKAQLRELTAQYDNSLITNNNSGHARISVSNKLDATLERQLKAIGYKTYQKFDGEDIPNEQLDSYIKNKIADYDYEQIGKNKPRMTASQKARHRYNRAQEQEINDRVISEALEDMDISRVKQTREYIECKEKYGEAAADAVFDL